MSNKNNISFKNKKAYANFEILEELQCGIALVGSEIKSIRAGYVSFSDSFCMVNNNELFLKNVNIGHYKEASINNHEESRDRKLLLKKQELRKFSNKVKEKGFTIIPLKIYINQKGLAKVMVALARGRNVKDKRNVIKDRDLDRQTNRELKNY